MPSLLPAPRLDSYDSLLYIKDIKIQDLINILSRNERAIFAYLNALNNQFQNSVESVNAVSTVISNLALTAQDIGFTIAGGVVPKVLTLDLNLTASTGLYIAGTNNRIDVLGSTTIGQGGQVGIIDISPVYPGQNTITTLGSIQTGTWNAGEVTAPLLRITNDLAIVVISIDDTGVNFGKDINNNDILFFVTKAIRRGNILYSPSDNLIAPLDPNITTTRKYLSQVGTGSVPNNPEWVEVTGGGGGSPGPMGLQGPPGLDGIEPEEPYFIPGVPGPSGPIGNTGLQGVAGVQGPPGLDGEDGVESFTPGIPGLTGIQGIPGVQGVQGLSGPPGMDSDEANEPLHIPGPQGIQGIQGIPGVNGIPGPPGTDAEDPEMVYIIPGPQGPAGTGGSGSSNTGRATLDFGAFPGVSLAEVDVTGQAGFITSSEVNAYILPVATADHSADEHTIESLNVSAMYKTDGTFTIRGHITAYPAIREINQTTSLGNIVQRQSIYGQFTIGWSWA